MKALMLSPESPYPLQGGGAFRTASLLHYFARFADIVLIQFSESGLPADLPPRLVRSQQTISLPRHNRSTVARYFRNGRRAIFGVPPLVERFAGLDTTIEAAITQETTGQQYDFGIVEHSWCAPYVDLLGCYCKRTILDLHNVESMLHERCAALSGGLVRAGHKRFAAASRKLERELFPRFSAILATSEEDAAIARDIAPGTRVIVYPNALQWVEIPRLPELPRIVMSGNFEYHPNIDAVAFLSKEIWPLVRRAFPDLRLRLVGRGDAAIRHILPSGPVEETGIEITGAVDDALSEIAQAQVVVAPVRTGSGTRIKILEAWAAARPVVATPLAAEGLDADPGVNIVLASGADEFAAEVGRLLSDPVARARLGTAGRRTFEHRYTWETAWQNLDIDLQLTQPSGVNGYTEGF
jgi:glycosyltransferase involved in cell wall biosynthesis